MQPRLWTAAFLLLATACGPSTQQAAPAEPAPTTTTEAPRSLEMEAPPPPRPVAAPVAAPEPTEVDHELADDTTLVARSKGEVEVYERPGEAEPALVLPATTILGTVTVLAAAGEPVDGWVEVMLPVRPNGSTGWVRVDDIDFYLVEGRIVVELGERRLTYYLSGEEVLSSSVAIGTSRNPTPTGTFFVTDSVTLSNPDSPWGPHALGISGRSETITEYNGGDGIIGIHGTNKPSSIGEAASLGCVRLPNKVITLLHSLVPIGTPVEIRA